MSWLWVLALDSLLRETTAGVSLLRCLRQGAGARAFRPEARSEESVADSIGLFYA